MMTSGVAGDWKVTSKAAPCSEFRAFAAVASPGKTLVLSWR